MAKPRVFVSSTYYDLKDIRESLGNFIESLGFDAVISEKGDVPYSPELPLDESCYREVGNCDIYVLIIGGRYGSEASEEKKAKGAKQARDFYDRYESITKKECEAAYRNGVPCYVLINRSVYAELETFRKNRENKNVTYAHVDSVNIFHFLDDILQQPRNNPILPFERFADIEGWLKEQWAGLFRELLSRQSSQQQLASLEAEVNRLSEINVTLKTYLEKMMPRVLPQDEAQNVIGSESKRLGYTATLVAFASSPPAYAIQQMVRISTDDLFRLYSESDSLQDFLDRLAQLSPGAAADIATNFGYVFHLSAMREQLGLSPWAGK